MHNTEQFHFHHETPVQIRFNDIDIMAHVNNSVYQNYFDLARTQYFEKVFKHKINWHEKALVLAKITIEYKTPIFIDESIVVTSKVFKIGNKSLTMVQQIMNKHTKEVKAKNEAVLVAYAFKKNKTIPLPDDWKSNIIGFEKDIDF